MLMDKLMPLHHPDQDPSPSGKLTLQTLSIPSDTNPYGDIFGGWLMTQMDLSGAILAQEIAKGRVPTVAGGTILFLRPVPVGPAVRCYDSEQDTGQNSNRTMIEVGIKVCKTGAVA